MYSTFFITKSDCMTCINMTLKSLGTLQGVFGAEIDQIKGIVEVSHTDEVTRTQLIAQLFQLGYPVLENDGDEVAISYDDPSIWGCAL